VRQVVIGLATNLQQSPIELTQDHARSRI